CGSVSPATAELEAQYASLPRLSEPQPYLAYKALEEYFGEELYGVISTELGGGNTAEALYVAALLGKNIIDADPAGRSVPELIHSTFCIFNTPIYPLAVANAFGDVAIFPRVVNDERAETLVRALAVNSKNAIGVVDHPAQAKTMRNVVIKGAISNAAKIGRLYCEAREKDQAASEYIVEHYGGYFLFRGEVSGFRYETEGGFTIGEISINGEDQYAGQSYRIWLKNENIISWRNGVVDVTVPDLICLFDDVQNSPVLNPFVHVGQKVSAIGLTAPAEWRLPRGLELFGPRHFGYDVDYVPIEKKYLK
ncbi:MAG: DUF917 domain-containing protein, partial [Anaerolineae bacterium]|nr:DUF917 domain-containing protein [Anaerolineae bacterium]